MIAYLKDRFEVPLKYGMSFIKKENLFWHRGRILWNVLLENASWNKNQRYYSWKTPILFHRGNGNMGRSGEQNSESMGNNLWAQLMKRELLSIRNAINMGCDIWNPIVRSYRLPYIAEAKQSTLEGIVSSIMLTLLKAKMMK